MSASEVFESLAAFDAEMSRQRMRNELRQRIRAIGTTCGDCGKWMKRGDCPRERGVMVGGPSSGEPKCNLFVEQAHSTRLRRELQHELAALEATTPQPRTP